MRAYLAMTLVVIFNIAATGFVKRGSQIAQASGAWFNFMTLIGGIAFALAFALYIFALRTLPLYVVQVFAAAQFMGVIAISHWLFLERIAPWQWAGIAMISAGILLVGLASPAVSAP
jgi:drug/metabolite transporter (DMT)-like permease